MEIPKVFSSKNIWSMLVVFVVVLSAFLLMPYKASAVEVDYIYFRIDTELNVLQSKAAVTIRWYCSDSTGTGLVTDNTASESAGSPRGRALDGTIIVASTSTEMGIGNASCSFDSATAETFRASASLDGWVARTWTGTFSTASGSYETYASMDYTIVVNGVDDELGTAITLNGSLASVSYSGTVASQSYSSGKKYIAGSASGGTIKADADNYVSATSSALTISSTASQSVDFGVETDSNLDESGLAFGVKVTVGGTTRFGEAISGVTGRTVTAGDSSGVSCTDGGSGNYYCPVPLAHTGVVATSNAFRGLSLTLTCTYTDRTAETDIQKTCAINATDSSGVGDGGGGSTYTYETTPTPSPETTPEVTLTPTPIPGLSPTPTPVSAILYRKANDPKVYIQGSDGTLTWVKTIEAFNAAGYRWGDVKVISGSEFAKMKVSEGTAPVTAALFRKASDPKVYVQGSDGTLTWVKTIEAFNAAGYKWSDVKLISGVEFAQMRVGGNVRVVKGIAFLRVRAGPSTANKVVGQVLPGQELKFTEIKNGWYHISSGWVSGAYAKEF